MIDEPATAHRVEINEQQLNELADSIRDVGLLNPIIVRPALDGRFEIIAGHRRYMAFGVLAKDSIECFVVTSDDNETEQRRFAENLQREQLSPMEEAAAIVRYQEQTGKDAKAIARALNRSEWYVQHRIDLMMMPPELCDMVHTEQLAASSALEMAKVTDAAHRNYLLQYCIKSGASVQVVREWVSLWKMEQQSNPEAEPSKPNMPVEGQEVIVQIPCYICHVAHDHRVLTIQRVCRDCHQRLNESS